MRTVHLHGFLGEKYGGPFRLEAFDVGGVIRGLQANLPDFLETIREGSYQLVKGEDPDTGECIPEELLTFGLGRHDLHIIPVVEGSGGSGGKGIITAVLGVALLATGIGAGIAAGGAAASFGTAMSAPIFSGGVGAAIFGGLTYGQLAIMGGILMIGGIYQALAPVPNADYDNEEEKVSFLFNGAINRMEQGGALPVVFGRFQVGSITVSAGIDVEEIA